MVTTLLGFDRRFLNALQWNRLRGQQLAGNSRTDAGDHQHQTGLYSKHVSKQESTHPSAVFPAYNGEEAGIAEHNRRADRMNELPFPNYQSLNVSVGLGTSVSPWLSCRCSFSLPKAKAAPVNIFLSVKSGKCKMFFPCLDNRGLWLAFIPPWSM